MKYREGYKYQLAENYTIQTPIKATVQHEYFTLSKTGKLRIKKGYAWDGASGPTMDTKDSMSPSLVHDVFCQAMRLELLSYNDWQDKVNEFFREHLKACGMGSSALGIGIGLLSLQMQAGRTETTLIRFLRHHKEGKNG